MSLALPHRRGHRPSSAVGPPRPAPCLCAATRLATLAAVHPPVRKPRLIFDLIPPLFVAMPPKEDIDTLLTDFGRTAPPAKRLAYAAAAAVPAALPILLFSRVFSVDVSRAIITLVIAGVAVAAVLSSAYHNLAFTTGVRLRGRSVPPTKASVKGDKARHTAALASHEAALERAAVAYSLFYNNALFVTGALFVGFYVVGTKVPGEVNYAVSGLAAASFALFNSRSALKNIGQ